MQLLFTDTTLEKEKKEEEKNEEEEKERERNGSVVIIISFRWLCTRMRLSKLIKLMRAGREGYFRFWLVALVYVCIRLRARYKLSRRVDS